MGCEGISSRKRFIPRTIIHQRRSIEKKGGNAFDRMWLKCVPIPNNLTIANDLSRERASYDRVKTSSANCTDTIGMVVSCLERSWSGR